jgi:CRISPR-associated endoribonuclease Cas6
MRIKLTLQKTGRASLLPINYNYEISAWIYKIIRGADTDYADFLHNQGYTLAGKQFKFFTFSALHIPKRNIVGDRIEILSEEISLLVSFWVEEASEKFIIGLFQNQALRLGDKISQVDFMVRQVESMAWTLPEDKVRFRMLSPLVVSRKNDRGLDDYLSPTEPDFEKLLLKNLLDKYMAAGKPVPASWQDYAFGFRLLTEQPKEKRIILKAHTPQQTKVKGYLFDFELVAPVALLEAGYLAGFGRYNAEGFGCVEVVK